MSQRKNAGGRPPVEVTDEMVDDAAALLGRRVFSSRVAADLARKHGVGRDTAYKAMDAARERVIAAFQAAGTASDPLVCMYLALQQVIADPKSSARDRVAAVAQGIKLLGLDRLLKQVGDQSIDEFIVSVMERRAARLAADPSAN